MKTPDRIYISPSIRTEIAYYSRILIGNPKFNICPRYGNEIEYIRADIHEAEIDALKAEVSKLCAELTDAGAKELALHNQLLSAEAELAALKAPPKVLSAEEVVEPGIYIVRDIDRGNMLSARHIDCVDIDIGVNLGYEYIGPLRLPEEV